MYHTRIIHTQGPLPPVLVDMEGHYYTRLVDVRISGAKGAIALRSGSPVAWLERVVADGRLEAPADRRLLYADPPHGAVPFGTQSPTGGPNGLWLIEHSRLGGAAP
jgi:hypothetical protein